MRKSYDFIVSGAQDEGEMHEHDTYHRALDKRTANLRETVLDTIKSDIGNNVASHDIRHISLRRDTNVTFLVRCIDKPETHIVVLPLANEVRRHRAEDLCEDLAVLAGGVVPEGLGGGRKRVGDGVILRGADLVIVWYGRRAHEGRHCLVWPFAVLRRYQPEVL